MLLFSSRLIPVVVSTKATLGGWGAPADVGGVVLANLGNSKSVAWYLLTGNINDPSGKESDVTSHGRVRV